MDEYAARTNRSGWVRVGAVRREDGPCRAGDREPLQAVAEERRAVELAGHRQYTTSSAPAGRATAPPTCSGALSRNAVMLILASTPVAPDAYEGESAIGRDGHVAWIPDDLPDHR